MLDLPLFIPVILGTPRQGRQSEYVAKFIVEQIGKQNNIETELIEYNHGYPGLLKHVLDTCLKEYIHKAVGLCGVSAGSFGGTRVIQNLLPVMRELGLVTIFYDLNFANVQQLFDDSGKLLDEATQIRRLDRFMQELIWMSTVLRYGRVAIAK
jgi:NAD(P)H-dependent FMN reductase